MSINDQPVRFYLTPDVVSVPTVKADVAEKIGLKSSMVGYAYFIGTVEIALRTDRVKYHAGNTSFRSRTAFGDRQVAGGADGVAGPATFPFRRICASLTYDFEAGTVTLMCPNQPSAGAVG
jgi:hypothetical protein